MTRKDILYGIEILQALAPECFSELGGISIGQGSEDLSVKHKTDSILV